MGHRAQKKRLKVEFCSPQKVRFSQDTRSEFIFFRREPEGKFKTRRMEHLRRHSEPKLFKSSDPDMILQSQSLCKFMQITGKFM